MCTHHDQLCSFRKFLVRWRKSYSQSHFACFPIPSLFWLRKGEISWSELGVSLTSYYYLSRNSFSDYSRSSFWSGSNLRGSQKVPKNVWAFRKFHIKTNPRQKLILHKNIFWIGCSKYHFCPVIDLSSSLEGGLVYSLMLVVESRVFFSKLKKKVILRRTTCAVAAFPLQLSQQLTWMFTNHQILQKLNVQTA